MSSKTRKIVIAAFFCSLVCVMTLVVRIPSPLNGYINLGDCAVLISGWMLPCGYGFLAAGTGSLLADLFSGYAIYAPASFVIKGLMAIIAHIAYRFMKKIMHKLPSQLISGLAAEVFMALGYFVFEGILYTFVSSVVNIPANCIQGVVGLFMGTVLINIFEKINLKI